MTELSESHFLYKFSFSSKILSSFMGVNNAIAI